MLIKGGELETDSSDSEATQDSELTSQVRRQKDETDIDSENNMVLLSYLIRRSQLEKYLETSISSDAFNDLDMKSLSDTRDH